MVDQPAASTQGTLLDYEGTYQYLVKSVGRYHGWPIDLEDLVHEAFLQLWRNATWPIPRTLAWRVLKYRAIDALAKWRMREKYIPWSLDLGWELGTPMEVVTLEPPHEAREQLRELAQRAHGCLLLYVVLPPALYTSDEDLGQILGMDAKQVKGLREDARRVLGGHRPVTRGYKRLAVLAGLAGY